MNSAGGSKETTPAFSLSTKPATPAAKPAEGGLFGAKPAEGGLFGAKPAAGGPSLFGAKPAELKGATPFSLNLSSSTPAPTGGLFGSLASAGVGSGQETKTPTSQTKPAFNFGASKPEDKPASTPAFSFGAKPDAKPDSTAATPATPAFSFGKSAPEKPKDDTAAAPTPSFSFGAKPSEKPEEKSAEKPSGFSFGAKPSDKPAGLSFGGAEPAELKDASSEKPAAFAFGSKPADSKPTPAFSFGAKSDESKPAAAASTGLSFGMPAEKKDAPSSEKKDDKPAFSFGAKPAETKPASTTPAFSFGNTAEKKDGTEKKDDKPTLSFGAKPDDKTTKPEEKKIQPDKNAPALKPTTLEPRAISLDNKTLEDLIITWSKQLTQTKSIFDGYTTKVKTWDQQLTTSSEEISKLHKNASEVESLQQRIDQQLFFVESQQDELDQILDSYELQADILLNSIDLNGSDVSSSALVALTSNRNTASGLNVTDKLREKAYHNAELLDERLDTLGDNLSSLVEEINSVSDVFNKSLMKNIADSEGSTDSGNSIEEIVRLLNLHLDNLRYIETTKDQLEEKVKKLQNPKRLQ